MSGTDQTKTWAFASLLTGGILLVAGALAAALMFGTPGWHGATPMGGMMNGGSMWRQGVAWWMSGVGLVAGALVLAAATQLRRAHKSAEWSIVAIVAGALSLFMMGGFVVGALAAVIGGVLGLVGTRGIEARARDA